MAIGIKALRKEPLTQEEVVEFNKEIMELQQKKIEENREELERYQAQAISLVDESDLAGTMDKITNTFKEAKVYSSALDQKPFKVFLDFPEKGVVSLEVTE